MGSFTTIQSPGFGNTPRGRFSVLLLAAGYELGKIFSLADDAWKKVMQLHPFQSEETFNADFARKRFCAYTDLDPLDIDFTFDGKRLVVPEAQEGRVLERIDTSTVPLNFTDRTKPKEWAARIVWDPEGRFGDWGSLIVVLVKGDTEGELYQLSPAPGFPIPFVAVVVTGDHWHKVIARAIAQVWGYLGDEYEESGDGYLKSGSSRLDRRRPNVLLVDDSQRSELESGKKLLSVITAPPTGWHVSKKDVLAFHSHPNNGASPDETVRKPSDKIQLVEGAAGFRLNAFRSDFDCLMRRKPYSTGLPIQDKDAAFCRVCREVLDGLIVSNRDRSLETKRILLDSQRPRPDTVYWKTIDTVKNVTSGYNRELENVGATAVKWGYKLRVDDSAGLTITDVTLSGLEGSIYAAKTSLFESIGFRDLDVKMKGDSRRTLSIADSFANKKTPPVLETFSDAHDKGYLRGYRLSLTWEIPDRWDIEAVMSIVFKDVANDFDPGGAVYAVKCYPQLSMRYRRPPAKKKKQTNTSKFPKVEELCGTIEVVASNVIPTDHDAGHDFHHMPTGAQSVALFTDSNASGRDSKWDWDRLDLAELGADFTHFLEDVSFGVIPGAPALPEYGLWSADWESGRLLAGVGWGKMTSPGSLVGAIARRANMFFDQPGLPHWSWLFDYVDPEVTGRRDLIAVYDSKSAQGKASRVKEWEWPVPSDQQNLASHASTLRNYKMTVEKLPRQGAFDNVHINPDMGTDTRSNKIVAAPFCGDLCLHLHWRWGEVTLVGSPWRKNFLGWGDGHLDRGAHTLAGAPLIPPNQKLWIKLDKQTGKTSIRYDVTAHDPDFDAYQVFMEQGIGVAFNYLGLSPDLVTLLAIGVGEWGPTSVEDKPKELRKLQKEDPAKYNEKVRAIFHKFYPRIRFYSEPDVKADVQQVPESSGESTDLEDL